MDRPGEFRRKKPDDGNEEYELNHEVHSDDFSDHPLHEEFLNPEKHVKEIKPRKRKKPQGR